MGGEGGFVVTVAIAVHGVEQADVVDDVTHVREEVAHHDAAFSVGLERPVRTDEVALELTGFVEPTCSGDAFSVVSEKGGFVVE